MGVITTADEKISQAKEYIRKASDCLKDVIDEETWGNSDFKKEYLNDVEEVALKLLALKSKL